MAIFTRRTDVRRQQPDNRIKPKNETIDTIIGPETKIEGTIHINGTARIDGQVSGNIIAENGTVIIGNEGYVEASIRASNLIINGEVHGNMYVLNALDLMPTGRLYGYVLTRGLQIADGALFRGNCDMIQQATISHTEPDNVIPKEEDKIEEHTA